MSSAAPGRSAPACRPRPGGPRPSAAPARGGDADRRVDEEDPVPVDGLGEHAAGQQADRAAGGGDEAVDAERLGLLPRLREHRHDHAEDHGGGQRAADALHEARADQHALVGATAHSTEAAVKTARPVRKTRRWPIRSPSAAGQQEQAAEGDQVGVDDPGEVALAEAEVVLDGGQRDVHDRGVEHDHQHADAQHVERDPARAVLVVCAWPWRCRCVVIWVVGPSRSELVGPQA